MAVSQGIVLILMALLWVLTAGYGETAPAPSTAILSNPLAKIDIKDADIEAARGTPKGKLTIAQHYALDPGWLDPLEHQAAATQLVYDYLVHDAMLKPMPQGLYTYSLAERAELTADFTKAAFRLRPGLKFHDGQPLTTADVKWTYEHYKGVNFKIFQDKLDRIEIVDDRTIIFHFKEPFVEFIDLYNGGTSGSVWILPQHYYEKVGREGFIARPVGAGPFKFVSQEAGVQMVFEAWQDYWRRTPAAQTLIVKGIRDPASRLAGLQTGELDLAFGMTGKLLSRLIADRNLRWDPNLTAPWWLAFPGYAEPDSPFHDKRVRQAVSLALNRKFLSLQETQGHGIPWGNWIGPEYTGALKGDGTELPMPEYSPEQAKQLLAQAGFPKGLDFEWYVPWTPYFDMGERILTDLGAVGIKGKLQVLEGPAYRAKLGQGRQGYPGNRTILQIIGSRPGGAKDTVGVYAVCGGSASLVCETQIEALWAQHQGSTDLEERDRLIKAIQRILIEEYYFVPIYINSFVHAIGPRVLPASDAFHRYWDTPQAGYPVPWEDWQVKE
jgi:peptide/nickel transport system substrate-binding protein